MAQYYIGLIGSDFEELRSTDTYYVDKSLLVKELLQRRRNVYVFTRPRRFGKSLALSMLNRFFNLERAEENRKLFEGLKISGERELCERHQGKYPVISISFKSLTWPDYEQNLLALKEVVARVVDSFAALWQPGELSQVEAASLKNLAEGNVPLVKLTGALQLLTQLLNRHYGQKVILLWDEYDVPLNTAFVHGYYEQMLPVIRGMMCRALKDNEALKIGVVTGCLRIAKDSIFTGFNNPYINTVMTTGFPEYFGFTEEETRQALEYFGVASRMADVRQWYDGYCFGEQEVYNPVSILSYVEAALNGDSHPLRTYWGNTSGNDVLLRLLQMTGSREMRQDVETLLAGGSVSKPITEDTTFRDAGMEAGGVWSTMLFTGYLKLRGTEPDAHGNYDLALPNYEIKALLLAEIPRWYASTVTTYENTARFVNALLEGKATEAEEQLNGFLVQTISVRDFQENYYHGFVAGLLKSGNDLALVSQREQGDGYPDLLASSSRLHIALVLEIKCALSKADLENKLLEGEKQFRKRRYDGDSQNPCRRLYAYAIAFFRKSCRIRLLN